MLKQRWHKTINIALALVLILAGILADFALPQPVHASAGWYNASWQYRKTITIDYTKVSGSQTNFPVLINLTSDSDLAAHARSNGFDILFTSSDGTTKLSHEIEKYTSATGELVAWVKVPSLSSTADTVLYMYYMATLERPTSRTRLGRGMRTTRRSGI